MSDALEKAAEATPRGSKALAAQIISTYLKAAAEDEELKDCPPAVLRRKVEVSRAS